MHTVPRLYEIFHPTNYDLQLELDRAGRRFRGHVTITGDKVDATRPITLHAKDLMITSVQVDDRTALRTVADDFDQLTIDAELEIGTHVITLTFEGTITDGMHGLYPCYYQADGRKQELLATQFESHHAREVFPCIDEPEAKATFDLTLTSESDVAVLSNMPQRTQATRGEQTITTFQQTPRMSTYLLAFVVGDLQKHSGQTKSGVEVNVWATKAQPADSLIFPLEVAIGSIDFFDDYFGVPYPLPKADHVALPDFSSGAMENWGLITYREIALLVDKTSSVSTREYVATVIAHETSHQWFGNLVTMRWWDDLWLNESFATIMEYVAVDALYPEWNTWSTFASQETLSALRRDQLAGVQAVKCEVNHPDEISSLFDPSIVYAKGGRLLKMLRSYIGDDAFRRGLQTYFKTHAYSNTVGADLWAAFADSSGKDVRSFMETWISQPGLPLVTLRTTADGYALSQERFVLGPAQPQATWPIPLFAANPALPELLESESAELKADHKSPLLNKDNDAHFVTHYDEPAWNELYKSLAANELSPITRLALLHETSLLARGGKTATAALLPLLEHYRNESSEPVWNIISMVIGDLKRFVEEDERSETALKTHVTALARPQYERLTFDQTAGETEQDTKLRAIIIGLLVYGEYEPVVTRCLGAFRSADNLSDLPSETRAIIFSAAARHGTPADFERLLGEHTRTSNAELRDDITSGLCSTREASHIQQLLARLTDSESVKKQDLFRWYIYLLRNRYARHETWQWMVDHWSWIEETFKGDKSYDDFARYSANVFGSKAWLDSYVTFFEPLRSQAVLTRAIEIGTVEIRSRSEWLERDGEAVRNQLLRTA